MAPSAKISSGDSVGNNVPLKASNSNGVITQPPTPAVNRKKAKRRAKEKARRDAVTHEHETDGYTPNDLDDTDLAPPGGFHTTHPLPPPSQQSGVRYDPRHPNDPRKASNSEGSTYAYPEEDNRNSYDAAYTATNGLNRDLGTDLAHDKERKKKKKKSRSSAYDPADEEQPTASYYNPPASRHRMPPTITEDALRTVEQKMNDDIWEISSREERDRIRQFWLKLPEKERRDLVRIEKDAVLKKMKEQQKHSCSCTVCGRKRTAIEEELEQLYDAYYAELEGYANTEKQNQLPNASLHNVQINPALKAFTHTKAPSSGRIHELPDNEDEPDALEDDCDEEDEYSAEDYAAEDYAPDQSYLDALRSRNDFFTFGQNLTVKGGILTVADDLLSNHGEKFIDMMEQLANARMRRENQVFASYSNQSLHDTHPDHYPDEGEYDEDGDDGEDYDEEEDSVADEYEEEEDEMDCMSNHQRMDEGRRMFQIFAARMFEQRVLGAYREDVSKKKAEQLIAEEEAEKHGDVAREAKKARDAEKKKARKQAKKQERAEKEQKKEADRLEAERLVKEAEARRQEEQRLKREEQRRKRDAEKKAQDEERRKRDEDRRRQQEELKTKQQERERQAREAKTADKKRKEEGRKRQQEEKEARTVAARERKMEEERGQREREYHAKVEVEASQRIRQEYEMHHKPAQVETVRKAPPPAVALPPSLKHQKSQTGSQASPQAKTTTPAISKTATPQQRQPSTAASHASNPLDTHVAQFSKQSTSPAPSGAGTYQPPSSGLTRMSGRLPQHPYPPQIATPHPMAPPPGMPYPPQTQFAGMPPHAANGLLPGVNMPGMHNGFGAGRGMFPMSPQMGIPFRPAPQHSPHLAYNMGAGMHGMTARGFGHDGPPPSSAYGASKALNSSAPRPTNSVATSIGTHSRQTSSSFETSPADNNNGHQAPQPISRPAPIQRPDSTKPERQNRAQSMPHHHVDHDDERFLGSSALLGDSEPSQDSVERRQTAPHLSTATTSGLTAFGQHTTPFVRAETGFSSPLVGGTSGWGGWAGPAGFASSAAHRHGAPRLTMVRRLACEVLGDMTGGIEIGQLLQLVNNRRPSQEPYVQMHDLQSILDTEGDAQNGGGTFDVQSQHSTFMVSWRPNRLSGPSRGNVIGGSSTTGGLGEIGSPLPGASRPFS